MDQFPSFISMLMASRSQAHVYHLLTTSFAAHKALQDYYEGIVDLIDGLAESYQGRYGIIRGYKNISIKEDDDFVGYFENLSKYVDTIRQQLPKDTYLENQYDEVTALIESTKYKLKHLH
jgi:hypothetical protein